MTSRVGILGMWHETNTFSARPTTLADFRDLELATGDDIVAANADTGSVIGGFLDHGDFELVPVFAAGAWPSGPTDSKTMTELLERAEAGLRRTGGLDGLLVNLHGAMVAEGVDDVEGAVLALAREVVGDIPIAGVLDLHANVSVSAARLADVLISYDTYPHVDMRERGQEAGHLLRRVLEGTQLKTSIVRVPMLICPLVQGTDDEPMRPLVERARERAAAAGLVRICIAGGFAYSDVARAGITVLAVHDADRAAAAAAVLDATVADIESCSSAFELVRDTPARAVARAIASDSPPVFLADVADNVGGGSPGDGTAILDELLRQGASGAIAIIADRDVASLAHELGVGSELATTLGAKTDALHGRPLAVRGRVESLSDGVYRTSGSWMTGKEFSMGRTAVVAVDGVRIVVTERATPPFHAEQITMHGIDVGACKIVVMKGALAWRAPYGSYIGDVIEVASPGICPVDPMSLPRSTRPVGARSIAAF